MFIPLTLLFLLPASAPHEPAEPPLERRWFPGGSLFEPLAADLRWPHLGLGTEWYVGDRYLESTYSVALGGTVPVWRSESGDVEWGLQGGVFSVFDRDQPSLDLFNSDYVGAAFVAGRFGEAKDMSYLVRVLHISTHVGDEYLINFPEVERENFSFERADAFLSRDFDLGPLGPARGTELRVYGGLGAVIGEPEPADWGYLRAQWGSELRADVFDGRGRLFLAADVQHEEARDFVPDLSLSAGWELPTGRPGSAFRASIEYYVGREPNGQFWRDDVQIVGVGLSFTF